MNTVGRLELKSAIHFPMNSFQMFTLWWCVLCILCCSTELFFVSHFFYTWHDGCSIISYSEPDSALAWLSGCFGFMRDSIISKSVPSCCLHSSSHILLQLRFWRVVGKPKANISQTFKQYPLLSLQRTINKSLHMEKFLASMYFWCFQHANMYKRPFFVPCCFLHKFTTNLFLKRPNHAT